MANIPLVPLTSPPPPPPSQPQPSPPTQAPSPPSQAPPPQQSVISMSFTTKLSKGGHKTLTAAANLANLLPTGTVLTFQALIPSLSNNGTCVLANKYLTLSLIMVCSIACFLSTFTDSFIGKEGKLYYGIATFGGLHIFNDNEDDNFDKENNLEDKNMLLRYKITLIDFVHAFVSLVVFLVFAISSSYVQSCFFAKFGENEKQLIMNLPLGAGLLSSFLFMIFPTKRRGIGYEDRPSGYK